MPVRFTCPGCRCVLNAADHKVGLMARCPSCSAQILVPRESEPIVARPSRAPRDGDSVATKSHAGATQRRGDGNGSSSHAGTAAGSTATIAPPKPTAMGGPSVTDSVQIVSRPSVSIPAPAVAAPGAATPKSHSASVPAPPLPTHSTPIPSPASVATTAALLGLHEAAERAPGLANGVFVSRQIFYAQGLLIAIVAAGAFAAGHYIAGGSGNPSTNSVSQQQFVDGIFVEGSIRYWTPRGAEADAGAIVLLLPVGGRVEEGKRPDGSRLAPGGSRSDSKAAREALEAAGCVVVEADASGVFREAIPVAGEYDLLIVSRNLARNADASGLNDFDRAVLNRFVDNPAALVGNQAFRYKSMPLRSGSRIEHEFRQ